jgi:hypothetical protein
VYHCLTLGTEAFFGMMEGLVVRFLVSAMEAALLGFSASKRLLDSF